MKENKTDAVVGAICLFYAGIVVGLIIAYIIF
jgi:hypothetical protein